MKSYFDRLERELVKASRTRSANRRRAIGFLAALVVVAVPAVGAATGAFRPYREPDGLVRLAPRTVVAEGETPAFGRWQIITSDSSHGECMGLRRLDGLEAGSVGEGCGGPPGVGSSGGGTEHPNALLVHGKALPGTARVRLMRDGRAVGEAGVIRGPEDQPGPWFGVETRRGLGGLCLEMLDAKGDVIARVDAREPGVCGIPEGADPSVRG